MIGKFLIESIQLNNDTMQIPTTKTIAPFQKAYKTLHNDYNENRKISSTIYGKLIVESLSHLYLLDIDAQHLSYIEQLNMFILNVAVIVGNWSPEIKHPSWATRKIL